MPAAFLELRLPLVTSTALVTELFHLIGDSRRETKVAVRLRGRTCRLKAVSRATRRRFLEVSASAAVAAWVGSLVRGARARAAAEGAQRVATVPFVGEGAFPLEATIGEGLGRRRAVDLSSLTPDTLVTPQERFFIRTGCPDRLPASWTVRVHGLVETPRQISIAELRREAAPRGVHLLECAGNSTGVPLARVMERARPRRGATRVLVSGFDEHSTQDPGSVPGASWVFGLDQIHESGAFLATAMNGGPLLPDHGHPVRLVVPGWYGCTAIKWVNEIALVDDEAPATDQMREYAGRTHQDPAGPRLAREFQPATIDPAAVPVRVEKLRTEGKILYRIVGILWGGRAPVRALLIRLSPDAGFAPVEHVDAGGGRTWTLWSHTFRPRAPGRYRIEMKVTDRAVRTRRLDAGYYAREIEITEA
jgi:DMSO/TMAO reductase YedYZ molybdopterin-dependent catalytic subunit